jgi:lipopolysaccharide export system protein LptA
LRGQVDKAVEDIGRGIDLPEDKLVTRKATPVARLANIRTNFDCRQELRWLAPVYLVPGPVLPLQADFAAVRWAFAMRSLVFLLAGLFASAGLIHGEFKTPENAPIEITSTGQTTYENGLATARDNVTIHIGNTDIYADYAQYNSSTHDVTLRGHVRIYRDVSLYTADSGVYNTETKKIRATTGRTESQPYFLAGHNVTSI